MNEIKIIIDRHIFLKLSQNLKEDDKFEEAMDELRPKIFSVMPSEHCCPCKQIFLETDYIWNQMKRLKAMRKILFEHIVKKIIQVNGNKQTNGDKQINGGKQ